MPRVFEAAVDLLDQILSADARRELVAIPREEVETHTHFALEMWIHNILRLYADSRQLMWRCGARHSDGATAAIALALWDHLDWERVTA